MGFTLIILLIGVIIVLSLLLKIDKGMNTLYIFKEFLLVSFGLWYIIPISLSLLGYWYVFEYIVDLPLTDYIELACFEVWFYAIILILFSATKRIRIPSLVSFVDSPNVNKILVPCMIAFVVGLLIYNFLFRFDYLEMNEIENTEGGIYFILGVFNFFFLSFLWTSIVKERNGSKYYFFILIILANITYFVLAGYRIYLLAVIWLLYFTLREKILSKKRYILPLTGAGLGALLLLPMLANIRVGEEDTGAGNKEQMVEMVFEHLNIKLNTVAYGSVLVENDGIGFAGTTPYVGSIFKFIPRTIWEDKPTPTSFNSEPSGIPSRRAAYLISGSHGTYNVGVAPGLISLWHGYYSVVLAILLNVLLLRIIANSLRSKSILMNSIGFSLFYFPQLVMTPAPGDAIIQRLLEILLIFVLLIFSGFLQLTKKENY